MQLQMQAGCQRERFHTRPDEICDVLRAFRPFLSMVIACPWAALPMPTCSSCEACLNRVWERGRRVALILEARATAFAPHSPAVFGALVVAPEQRGRRSGHSAAPLLGVEGGGPPYLCFEQRGSCRVISRWRVSATRGVRKCFTKGSRDAQQMPGVRWVDVHVFSSRALRASSHHIAWLLHLWNRFGKSTASVSVQ